MKSFSFLFISAIILFTISCDKNNGPVDSLNESYNATQATLLKKGNFNSNAHTVKGSASLYASGNSKVVAFESFSTEKGPDLKVYLSTTTGTSDFIDLGTLKANSGSFYYTIDSTNTYKYNYVLIWCKSYSVLFGNSNLQ